MRSTRLVGKRVVVTRPESRCASWIGAFSDEGAEVIHEPIFELIGISGSRGKEARERLIGRHGEDSWMAFSSAATVRHFAGLLESPEKVENVHWAAVGPATSAAMDEVGIAADVVGDGTGAENLARLVLETCPSPDLLHLTSDQGLPLLCDRIEEAGGKAKRLVLSLQCRVTGVDPDRWLFPTPPDLLTFASPSAAGGLLIAASPKSRSRLFEIPALAPGGTTAGFLREKGWTRVGQATHDAASMVDAAVEILDVSSSP